MTKARNIADIGSNDVLDTDANGVDVTGSITADTLTVSADQTQVRVQYDSGTNQYMELGQSGGASAISFRSNTNDGELYLRGGMTATNKMKIATNGDIIMYKDDGSTAGMTFDASAGSIAVGTLNLPSDVSVVAADGIKIDVGTSDTTRIYAKSTGTGVYSLGTSGGSAIAFHRLGDNSDEIGFETHHAGNNHTERMRLNYHGQLTLEGTGTPFDTTPSKNGLQLYYESDSGIATIGSYSSGGGTVLDFRANSGGNPADANAMRIGSNYVTVNPDANAHDFIVKSDTNSNMLFVDGSANYVSFGTNATDIGSSSSGEGVTYRNGESLRVQRVSGSPIIANRVTDDGSIVDFRKNGAGVGSVGVDGGKLTLNSGGSNLVFQTGGTSRVNIDSTQMYPQTNGAMSLGHPSVRWNHLRLNGGIYFDGNTTGLDDYEEGNYTYTASYGTSGFVGSVQGTVTGSAKYIKIGNVVTVHYTGISVPQDDVALYRYSLPFNSTSEGSASVGECRGSQFRYGGSTQTTTTMGPYAYYYSNNNYLNFGYSSTASDFSGYVHYPTALGSSFPFVSITYLTS